MTNFERLKQMSVEEFAKEMLCGFKCEDCKFCDGYGICKTQLSCIVGFIEWLNEEVKTDES